MKTKYITAKLVVVAVVSAVLVLISLNAGGGGLEPPGPPGSSGSSMPSLKEIYTASMGTQPPPLPLAFDCYLKIDGIPGGSTDDKHKDWIEVLAFNHGISQSGTVVGGPTSERCDHEDFSIVKTLDKATPNLFLACCNGQHIMEVTLELCKAGGDRQKFMEYKFQDLIISSVKPSAGTMTSQVLPLEEVSFNYGKIRWNYMMIDPVTGRLLGNIETSWDLTANKGG